MAKESVYKFRFKKNAVGCSIGVPDNAEPVGEERDTLQSHQVPETCGSENVFLEPGDEFVDVHGHLQMKREHGEDHFVKCSDENVASKVLKVPKRMMIFDQRQRLLGFYGWQYVLDDVSAEFRATNKIGANRAQNIKALQTMDAELTASRQKEKEAAQENAELRAKLAMLSAKAKDKPGESPAQK